MNLNAFGWILNPLIFDQLPTFLQVPMGAIEQKQSY